MSGILARDLTTSVEIRSLLRSNGSPSQPMKTTNQSEYFSNDIPNNILNRNESTNNHILEEILLKVRIANSKDPDFIEIEISSTEATYLNLLKVCCRELELIPEQISRIRKLPDTRIRSDADVRRLKSMQELEVVLKESNVFSHTVSSNIYPSISANKNQTVLY